MANSKKNNLNKIISVAVGLVVAVSGYYLITSRASAGVSLFSDTTIPKVIADPDTQAVELGVKFRTDVAGTVTGIRYYKSTENKGTHVGNLWATNGTKLASATFANETETGWQKVTFPTPVAVSAGTTYIASYHAPTGRYAADEDFFQGKGADNGPLHALADGVDGPNGVYKYGTSGFPKDTYKSSNYYVDVLFTPNTPEPPQTDSTPPNVSLTAPSNGGTVSGVTTVTATATDNVGVSKVEFLVDDVVKGSSQTTPYSYSLDTTSLTNATHTIVARAYDAKGNKKDSATITVTVNNTQQPPVPSDTQTVTFTASQDASIRSSAPNRNYGTTNSLVAATGPDRHYLLKFDVSGLAGKTVKSAKLRMYVNDSSPNGGDLHVTSTDSCKAWNERQVTWNTAPEELPPHVGNFGSVASGKYAEATVTNDVVKGDEPICFRGDGSITNTAGYNSKDAGSNPPQLVITLATATGGTDTTPPTAPANLKATTNSPTQVNLVWDASTDNIGVTKYEVYRNNAKIAESPTTTYVDSTVSANSTYTYFVKAKDEADNISPASNSAQATTPSPVDTTAPTMPGNLRTTSLTSNQAVLAWDASTDNVGITKYLVYRNGTLIGQPTTATFTNSGLTASTTYTYTVRAQDAAGNMGPLTTELSVTTPAQTDTSAPSVPSGVQATAASPTRVNLSWTASTDNVGVTKYLVYRGQSLIGQPTTTTFSDTTAVAGTQYSYTVRAQDAAGNTSAASAAANVTTPNPPDTTAPSVPTNVQAIAASANQVNVSWTASTDNVGVKEYIVLRDGTPVGQPTTLTTFGDATVSPNTTYAYTVKARDAAGNESALSSPVGVNTPSTTPPIGLQLWSNPATWGGRVPQAGDTVTIPSGTKVLLDVDAPRLSGITINGELHFADRDTTFRSSYIAVYGRLVVGTETQPLNSKITIVLDGSSGDTLTAGGLAVGANVMVAASSAPNNNAVAGGIIDIHGRESGKQWTRLAETVFAGSKTIKLMDPVTWQPGDSIVIASSDVTYKNYDEAKVAARSADGKTITLENGLGKAHASVVTSFTDSITGETRSVEERAEVGLLSHNIRITGPDNAAQTQFGGHTMNLKNSITRVSNVEYVHMGQIGVLGRYALHWHLTGNASASSVRNVSTHANFNRFLTIHQTDNLRINGFVGHNTWGHGIMLEDGVEKFNVMNDMLVMTTKRPPDGKRLRLSDDVTSNFWVTHPTNDLTNSSAAGGEGAGIWYDFNFNSDNIGIFDAVNKPLGKFENLVSHSQRKTGSDEFANEASGSCIVIEGLYGVASQRAQPRNLTGWKCDRFGLWLDGAYTANNIYAANSGVAYNGQDNAVKGGLLVGSTENTGAEEGVIGGLIRFYHGQVDVDDVWLANYDPRTGSAPDKVAISDNGASTTDATNRVRNLKFFGPGSNIVIGKDDGNITSGVPRVLHASNSPYFDPQQADHSHWFQDMDGSVRGDRVNAYITNREVMIKSNQEKVMWRNVGRDYFQGADFGGWRPVGADGNGFLRMQFNGIDRVNMTRLDTGERMTNSYYPAFTLGKKYRMDSGGNFGIQVRGSDPGWVDVEFPNATSNASVSVSGGGLSGATKVSSLSALGDGQTYYYDAASKVLTVRIAIKGTPIPFGNGGDYRTIDGDWANWEIRR